jgi:hypothetical protein
MDIFAGVIASEGFWLLVAAATLLHGQIYVHTQEFNEQEEEQ